MPDAALHHNGTRCSACELRREAADRGMEACRLDVPCNNCGGIGRVPVPVEEIVAADVAWARRFYWPERVRRWADG